MGKVKAWATEVAEEQVDKVLADYKDSKITRAECYEGIMKTPNIDLIGIQNEDSLDDVIYHFEVENNINNRDGGRYA